jgi:DNA-binding Xre family transcriptional regulator
MLVARARGSRVFPWRDFFSAVAGERKLDASDWRAAAGAAEADWFWISNRGRFAARFSILAMVCKLLDCR